MSNYRPLVPPARKVGALPWLAAAATLLLMLGGGFALAANSASRALSAAIAHRVIVQVVEPDPARRAETAQKAFALLRAHPSVKSVEHVPDSEVARLITPYINGRMPTAVPLPALIESRLDSGADAKPVSRAVGALPGILATSAEQEAGGLARLLVDLRSAAVLVMGVTAAVTGLVATLAARAALAAEQASLAILHELGATDRQLSALVLHRIGRDAAIGAAVGLLLGIILIATLGVRLAPLGLAGFGIGGWLLLLLLPIALLLLALATAQTVLFLSLRRVP